MPVGKVHKEKASDVSQCCQKRTAPKGGTRGIADACETDASDCGKNTVVDDIVGEFKEIDHKRIEIFVNECAKRRG